MAITKFNSIDGYTVNESTQITVVDANANFYANNLTVTAASDLGAVGNVKITGGTANYILQTNGSGLLSWTNPGAIGLAGSNREVQFNNDGNFGASSNFTFNSSTNLLTVSNLTVTSGGTSNLGNLATANYISGNGYAITGLPLGNLSDVVLSYPSTGQILTYNGVNWINGSAGSSSAGQGVKYWLTSTPITSSSINNSFEIDSLSQTPYTPSSTLLSTSVNNNTLPMAAWETNALNRTIFDAGSYDFSVYANINAVGGTNTFELDFYQVIPFVSGTVTITGSGTSRTATASTGTPFSGVTASGTNTTSSWLQTPNGLYQITAKTNDTVVTISTPSGYSNENAVAGQVWNQLFKSGSMEVVSTVLTEFQFSSTQPSFNVTVASKLGIITFVTSDTTKTLTFSLDGSVQDSHFTTPWVILHDDLAGLQGGTNEEYFHLTTSEYTANGTGTFIRQSGATLITPNVGVASGTSLSVTGNISSGNANLGNLVTANYFSGTLTTGAQPNITSLGTLVNLTITENLTSGNANLGNLATANYFSGNGSLLTSINGSNITGTIANANYSTYAGTVLTNAQPNITSVGTLDGLTITGNLVVNGNVTVDGSNSNLSVTNLTVQDNTIDISAETIGTPSNNAGIRVIRGDELAVQLRWNESQTAWQFTNDGVNYQQIVGKDTTTGNVSVGNISAGNLVSATYFSGNGSLLTSITGANITGTVANANYSTYAGTVITAAQPNITSVGTLVNTTLGSSNSLSGGNLVSATYLTGTLTTAVQPNVTSLGSLSGLTVSNVSGIVDFNITSNVTLGAVGNLHISGGTSGYVLRTDGSGVLSWVNPASAGLAGSNTQIQFNDNSSFGADANLTFDKSTDTLGTKNIVLEGPGSLTGGNLVSANYLTGTLITALQPNITSVGTLANLSVGGDAVVAGNFTVTGTTTFINVDSLKVQDPIIELGGGANGTPLITNDGKDRGSLLHYYNTGVIDAFMGWDNSNAEFAFGSNVSVSSEVVTFNSFGNIRANYFLGNGSQLTGIIGNANYSTYAGTVITAAQPNITSVGTLVNTTLGASNSFTGGNLVSATYLTGTLTTEAQPNITSVGTLVSLSVTGNVTSGNANLGNLVTATYFSGNGILISDIAGANVSGQVGNALVAGTVYTNAQPNITSVGSLSGLTVSNTTGVVNFTTTANVTLGAVANLHISGGTSGAVLSTDGSGVLTWISSGSVGVAGTDTQIQFNDVGNFGADGNFTFAKSTSTLSTKNITLQGTGNLTGGNLVSANYLTGTLTTPVQPNITSVGTLVSLSVTGNITSGNANLGNLVTSNYFTGTLTTKIQPNITSVGTLTELTVDGLTNLGDVGNLTITGGTAGYSLTTDGYGVLSWQAGSGSGGGFVSIIRNSFTGNGVQTNFNLSSTPTGEAALLVNLNGLIQLDTTYSLSGSTLIFSTAPAAGAKIEVTVYGALAITETDTQILFISGTSLSGSANFTFDNTTNTLSTTRVSATGNVSAGNIKTNNLLYANGDPYVFTTSAAGSDTQVQYNNGTAFGASANFTFNNTTKTLTVDKITANGAGITYITGANVNGNVTSAVQAHYANIANSVAGSNVSGQVGNALVAGTVYTNAQPNITSVGTLVSLSVSGDATVTGNFTVGGNTTYINVETFRVEDPIIELGGGVNGAPLVSNDGKDRGTLLHYYTTGVVDAYMGWDNSNAEFAFGSNVSVSSEVVTFNNFGNIRANYFIGNGATLTYITGSTVNGNVASAVQSHYANIANSVAGSNVSGQVGNALVAGTVYTNAQPNITSVGTLSSLTVTANITSGNASLGNLASATYFSGNGIFISNIAGANVSGNVTSAVQAHYANIANSVSGSNVSGQVGNALVAGTVYTNAQPNITSVGTLTSLSVTGNVTSGNANLGNLVTANFFSGDGGYLSNLQISSATVANANYANFAGTAFSVTGSNVSGQVGNALVAGTVYTNAQPNITSVGTLTSLTITGNITSGNADLGNLATASYFSGNGVYLSTITGANVSGNVTSAVRSHFANIANYVLGSDVSGAVANANYATWSGISFESFAVSGPNVVGGVANANYATYSGSAFSVTGSNVSGQVGNALVAGTVYTNAQPNITSVGALTSLSVSNATGIVDFTTTANVTLGNVSNLHITGGTAGYVLKTDGAGNLSWGIDTSAAGGNTTEIQFNDSGSLNGNTKLTFDKTTGLLTVTGNIATTNANLGNLVTANYFTGDGSYLTNITGANVTGNVSIAVQSHYANIANSVAGSNVSGQVSNALVAGTVYTNAQPNITSVGTLTSLDITGNITSGNANLGNLVTATYFSGNGSLLTGLPAGYANSNVAAYLPTYTGNVSANYFIGNGSTLTYITGANVTGNVTSAVQSHFANIANSVDGSNVSGQVGNALVAGTVYTNAQPNITSVGTLTSLTVTGNITSGNASLGNLATATYFSGDGSLLTGLPAGYANSNVAAYLPTYTGNVSANYFIGNGATLTYITGANVNGNVTSAIQSHYANIANSVAGPNVSGQVANALVAGTVYTNAQPNITSLGTLTALTVNGITTLGTVGNVKISGGTSGYVLTTNGSGDVSWQASGGSAGPGFVNIIKNSYVADGSQTAFILTTTPASEDAILVNIDGILQQDAAYTLSGSTVTMASAPYLGEVVEVTVYGTLGLGANTQVIFNDAGNVGATSNFIFNKTTNLLTVSNATVSSGLITLDTGTINVSSGNATIFTSGISNITVGGTSSNVISQGNLSAKNYSTTGNLTVTDTGTITSLKVNDLYSNRTPVNVSTNTVIDSFPVNKYRSAKYTMRVNSDDGYQAVEVLLIHDGSDSFVTIYGSITTSGTEIISLSSSILSGAVRVLATTTSTNTTVNLMATYVAD